MEIVEACKMVLRRPLFSQSIRRIFNDPSKVFESNFKEFAQSLQEVEKLTIYKKY